MKFNARWLKIAAAAFLVLGIALYYVLSNLGYGPVEDHSQFIHARMAPDGKTGLFTYNELVYRRATGIRAFPDGGIPKYLTDNKLIGLYDVASGTSEILLSKKNRRWCYGQGNFSVADMTARTALIIQSGQNRDDLMTDARYYLLDIQNSELEEIDINNELKHIDRELGYLYLLNDKEDILFISQDSGLPQGPELWLRRPDGKYAMIDNSPEYHGFRDGEMYYWVFATRKTMAYNIVTGTRRDVGRIDPSWFDRNVSVGLSVSGKDLMLSQKQGDQWIYQKIEINP